MIGWIFSILILLIICATIIIGIVISRTEYLDSKCTYKKFDTKIEELTNELRRTKEELKRTQELLRMNHIDVDKRWGE